MNETANIIFTIFLSLLTAYLGGYFAIRGFYQKKSWERRAQAYEELVASLYDVVQYCAIQKRITAKALDYLTTKSLSYGKTIGLPVPQSKKQLILACFTYRLPFTKCFLISERSLCSTLNMSPGLMCMSKNTRSMIQP